MHSSGSLQKDCRLRQMVDKISKLFVCSAMVVVVSAMKDKYPEQRRSLHLFLRFASQLTVLEPAHSFCGAGEKEKRGRLSKSAVTSQEDHKMITSKKEDPDQSEIGRKEVLR